jgi:putative exporter of polyketide antibiotics
MLDVDPVSAVPAVPFDDVGEAILRLAVLFVVGVLLAAAGAVLLRRRDVPA